MSPQCESGGDGRVDALPPAFMISTPASLAYFDMLTTIACSAKVAGIPEANRQPVGNAERVAAAATTAGSRRSIMSGGMTAADGAAPG